MKKTTTPENVTIQPSGRQPEPAPRRDEIAEIEAKTGEKVAFFYAKKEWWVLPIGIFGLVYDINRDPILNEDGSRKKVKITGEAIAAVNRRLMRLAGEVRCEDCPYSGGGAGAGSASTASDTDDDDGNRDGVATRETPMPWDLIEEDDKTR